MMRETSKCCSVGLFLGRLLLTIPFLMGGVSKLFNYDATAQFMASKGMTMVPFFLIAAIIIEILGSLSIIIGYKARWGALILMLFLIPTTLIFHDFWNDPSQMPHFFTNLALFGGLMYVATVGSGALSFDACCKTESSCCKK